MPPIQPCAATPEPGVPSSVHDVGGFAGSGGRMRRGLLYRFSGALLAPRDFETLAQAGVRLVVDLRGQDEDRAALQRWAAAHHVEYHHEPIQVARPDLLAAWGSHMAPDDATAWLRQVYQHVVNHHGPQLVAAITAISGNLPAAFGCAAGKDRTGLLTALIQSLLGVDRDEIARHYAAVAPSPERLAPIVRRWRRISGTLSPGTRAMLDAPPATIAATLDYVTERFGGVGQYLAAVGLDPQHADTLRRALLATA